MLNFATLSAANARNTKAVTVGEYVTFDAFRVAMGGALTDEYLYIFIFLAEGVRLKRLLSPRAANCATSIAAYRNVADDGPMTLALLTNDEDERAAWLDQCENANAAAAFNPGVARARGETTALIASLMTGAENPIPVYDRALEFLKLGAGLTINVIGAGAANVDMNFPALDNMPGDADWAVGNGLKSIYRALAANYVNNNMFKHVVELVAARQVRALKDSNIDSYFKAVNVDITAPRISPFIDHLANILPRLSAIPDFGTMRIANTWLKYHTNATSTPSLVNRFLTSLPAEFNNIITAGERAAIGAALADQADIALAAAIPRRIVAQASTYYRAANIAVGTWHQGTKAEAEQPPAVLAKWEAIFKKMLELQSNAANIATATTIPQLRALW